MTTHIKLDHKLEYDDYLKMSGTVEAPSQATIMQCFQPKKMTTMSSFRKKELDQAVDNYIIDSLRPLNTVEQECFVKMLNTFDPTYKVPTKRTVLSHLSKQYDTLRAKIQTEIKLCQNVAFTHDCWSSLNTQSFGATTAHYINAEWELKAVILGTKLFPGSHTSEAIAESLRSILIDEWSLNEEGLTAVTDNAANEKKAIDLLEWSRFSCQGHNSYLAVKVGLGVSSLIAKGRSLVGYFHKSPLAMDVLFKKQILLLEKDCQGHKLIQDVPTRWNSTLDMLERLTEQTPALHACISDPALAKVKSVLQGKLYNFEEQQVIDDIVKF